MRYKGNATNTSVASEKYSSPNSIAMIALKVIDKLLNACIIYSCFNKLGVGSISKRFGMTS